MTATIRTWLIAIVVVLIVVVVGWVLWGSESTTPDPEATITEEPVTEPNAAGEPAQPTQ
jgi:hypothetical protein